MFSGRNVIIGYYSRRKLIGHMVMSVYRNAKEKHLASTIVTVTVKLHSSLAN